MVSISSRMFSKGGGVGRRELGLRTGEQRRLAYYLRGGVLIIDNFAHSSRAAAIICFAFLTTLQDRPPASMSIRNVVSSVFRTALSALCLLHPLQYPVQNPRDLTHTSMFVPRASKSTCSRTRLTVLSNLSTGSMYVRNLPPGAQKKSSMSFAVDNSLHCNWSWFRERDRDTPPFVLSCGGRQDIIVVSGIPPG